MRTLHHLGSMGLLTTGALLGACNEPPTRPGPVSASVSLASTSTTIFNQTDDAASSIQSTAGSPPWAWFQLGTGSSGTINWLTLKGNLLRPTTHIQFLEFNDAGYAGLNQTFFLDGAPRSEYLGKTTLYDLNIPIQTDKYYRLDVYDETTNPGQGVPNVVLAGTSSFGYSMYQEWHFGIGVQQHYYTFYPYVVATSALLALDAPGQFTSNGITAISEGGNTAETSVTFKATPRSFNGAQVQTQIELRRLSEAFTGLDDGGILETPFVSTGTAVSIQASNLIGGGYRWRVRTVDDLGNATRWYEFGTPGNTDFQVDLGTNLFNQTDASAGSQWSHYGDNWYQLGTGSRGTVNSLTFKCYAILGGTADYAYESHFHLREFNDAGYSQLNQTFVISDDAQCVHFEVREVTFSGLNIVLDPNKYYLLHTWNGRQNTAVGLLGTTSKGLAMWNEFHSGIGRHEHYYTFYPYVVATPPAPVDPLLQIVPAGLLDLGAPLDFDAPRDRSFSATNVGGGLLQVAERITLPVGSPFTLILGTALELSPGQTGQMTVRFAPPAPGLFRAQMFLQTNDPGRAVVAINLAGEKFVQCDALDLFIENLPFFDVKPCKILGRLRDLRYFDVDRFDIGTRVYASDTQLFSYIQRHAAELNAVATWPDYAETVRQFVDLARCPDNAKDSRFLDMVEGALRIRDQLDAISNAVQLINDPAELLSGFTVSSFAADMVFMQLALGRELAEAVLCIGKLKRRQWIVAYEEQRTQFPDPDEAFRRAFENGGGILDLVFASFELAPRDDAERGAAREALLRYFEFIFGAHRFALLPEADKRVELKSLGRRIALCAVDEYQDIAIGRTPICNPEPVTLAVP